MLISPVNFTSLPDKKSRVSKEKKEEIRDGVVTGGAAGAGYTAVRKNTLSLIKETEAACQAGKAAAKTAQAAKAAQTAKESAGLFSGLKKNARVLSKRFINKLDAVKTSKYIKPIINNRITRFGCTVFGGFLAGCILVSGIGTLYNNSVQIAQHYVPKVAQRVNSAANIVNRLSPDKKED